MQHTFFFNLHSALNNRRCVRGNTGPKFRTLLSNRSTNGTALHFALVVHDDPGAVLEVDKNTLLPSETLALPDDDGRHDFLSQLWLSLLDGTHNHVSRAGLWEAVQSAANVADGDDVQVLGTRVVRAVHNGGNGKTGRNPVLDTRGILASARSCFSHLSMKPRR
mmetsp:Transcript_27048/g.64190  ORF Transcript_27048/g.64190 Transcript_27048/m.64190 type:complete len:164 (+) Transcript_27048:71-562(+)